MATLAADRVTPKIVNKADKLQNRLSIKEDHSTPSGGFDATPIPSAPPGYTVKFTFHRGDNLPVADFGCFSSDPYVFAQLHVALPQRHKQDPLVSFRTPTVHKNLNPTWNSEWIVGNVPASGFLLKAFVYDEDPANHDDKLGIAFINVPALSENWEGIKEQPFKIKKRYGSKRVYVFTNVSAFTTGHHKESFLIMSFECLGKTPGTDGGHMYTIGPQYWFKHHSPMIGRLTGIKDMVPSQDGSGKEISRYNFQATQIQLQGPVPPELYHRYVAFRPIIAGIFQARSLRGRILHKALHHQHQRIYNFDRTTETGSFPEPCSEFVQKFLELVHYGRGGRIFTYVITLDGQLQFTETGKEFGIDMLSKHTMHSDVSMYISYSGEFFIRRRKHRHRHSSPSRELETETENEIMVEEKEGDEDTVEPSNEPMDYELFIDNDSGTYRPNGEKLPLLKEFLKSNFPGLHITTFDSQADAETMQQYKEEQREFKKSHGHLMTYLQQSSLSSLSISSSDEDELNERSGAPKRRANMSQCAHEMHVKGQVKRWFEADGHADQHKHHYTGRARAASDGEAIKGSKVHLPR